MLNCKIIAVDFDGTLCENKYPDIGIPNLDLIQYLKVEQANGAKIILWTCRADDSLARAVNWCYKLGLIFDRINANTIEAIEEYGKDTRKIFAHEYIDDRMSTRFEVPFNSAVKRITGKYSSADAGEDDMWGFAIRGEGVVGYNVYQCKKFRSLFKFVYDDGVVNYEFLEQLRN